MATCSDPKATCVPNYCDGCNAVFYDYYGKQIDSNDCASMKLSHFFVHDWSLPNFISENIIVNFITGKYY